jgi:calcineurin-like phosphoesterase family protein
MKNIKEDIINKLTPECIEDMKHIWFLADQHHGHPKIVKICGRPVPLTEALDTSIPEQKRRLNELHNDWLIREVYNKYIDKKDEVYILGDVSMSPKIDAEKFIDRLNGNKHLIPGNHCKNILHSTRFSEIKDIKNFTYNRFGMNLHIVLCHYPIASWERKIHGSWHLYGHVHGRFETISPEIEKFLGLVWDVGIDNKATYVDFNKRTVNSHCKPLNLYDIVQIMSYKANKLGKTLSEFDYDTNEEKANLNGEY